MNPLVNERNQKSSDIGELFRQFKQNPVECLVKSKMKIPDNVGNDPRNIVQYLLNSGQVSQQTLNQAQAIYRQMGGR